MKENILDVIAMVCLGFAIIHAIESLGEFILRLLGK